MHRFCAILCLCSLLCLTGCAALDSFFGYDPATGEATGGMSTTAGAVGDTFWPWSSTVLGAIGWGYSTVRGKKYKEAAHSMVDSVDYVVKNTDKLKNFDEATIKELLTILQDEQVKRGTHKTINKLRS